MNDFLSKFVEIVRAPTQETVGDKILSIWNSLLPLTRINSWQSLHEIQQKIISLLNVINEAVSNGHITSVMQLDKS